MEEQFYIVLPLLIMWCPKRILIVMLLGLCGGAVCFRYALLETNPTATFTLLPGRMDLLLAGVILAYVRQHFDLSRHLQTLRVIPLVAMVVMIIVALTSRDGLFPVLNPMLLSVAFAAFILAILRGAPEGVRYRSHVLGYFGQISYALYLVHQPISGLLHGLLLNSRPDIGSIPQIAVTILAFAASVAVATASWRWLEQPILDRVPNRMHGLQPHQQRVSQGV